jgi:hypothetical protein
MLLSIREFWSQAMEIREARWIMTVAGLVVIVLVGFYVFKLFRDMALGNASFGPAESADFLTDFQKLRDEGKLNDDEYARLKQSIPTVRPGHTDSTSLDESNEDSIVNFLPPTESE